MTHRYVMVGIFVLVGLILFTTGIFLVGDRHGAFARHADFYTEFTNLNGLTTGSKVKVAGLDAGQIVDVGIPDSPSSRFRLKFEINEKLRGLVRTDSVVTIATEGVVGGTYLLVRPGSAQAPPAGLLATLPSKEPIDMSKLLEQGQGLLQDADTTVNRLRPKLEGTLDEFTTTVANANDLVVGLKQGRGTAGMLLRDKSAASDVRQAITDTRHVTADVRHASGQVDALTTDIQARGLPKKIDDTIGTAKGAASNIDESTKQIRQTIAEATSPDKQGVDAGENISESLSNVNTASANMADDTEALKHNFFLRGFFRRRGYYNLTNISPDKYRKDPVFKDPANGRAWLSSAQLFRKDAGESETLSAEGKELLNDAVVQYGDSVIDSPIVIEGYSNEGDPADQLASSRNRAILVREYLQKRYQLDRSNVGTVSMRNSPPSGVGHSPWDGICVVFVRHRH